MFHDLGLTERYRTSTIRFEVETVPMWHATS